MSYTLNGYTASVSMVDAVKKMVTEDPRIVLAYLTHAEGVFRAFFVNRRVRCDFELTDTVSQFDIDYAQNPDNIQSLHSMVLPYFDEGDDATTAFVNGQHLLFRKDGSEQICGTRPPRVLSGQHTALFECLAGSRMYGLDTDESDWDMRGVWVPPASDYISCKKIDEHWSSVGRDSDCVWYSLRKLLTMADNGNPTVLEWMFAPPETIVHSHDAWELIQEHRSDFVTVGTVQAYLGHAKKVMHTVAKRDSFEPKEAAHALRAAFQATHVAETRLLQPRVTDDQRQVLMWIKEQRNVEVAEVLIRLECAIQRAEDKLKANDSFKVRPHAPDGLATALLRDVTKIVYGREWV